MAASSSTFTSIFCIWSMACIARWARAGRVAQQLAHPLGDGLPAQAEPVLEPAALALRTAIGGQRVPEPVDLVLILAAHVERDGLGERELRPAVDGHVLLARQPEEHQRHVVAARGAVEALHVRHPQSSNRET